MILNGFLRCAVAALGVMLAVALPAYGQQPDSHAAATDLMRRATELWVAGDVAGSEPLYAEAGALVAAAPDDIFLVRIQGAMAAGMSVLYSDRQELAQSWEKYNDIKAMEDKFPNNRPLANARAQLATVLYPLYVQAKQPDKADALRNDVEGLKKKWPLDPIIGSAWEQIGLSADGDTPAR